MSSRPGIEVTYRLPADGGVSPNKYDPYVSAHIRVYWPPLATEEQITRALVEASAAALQAVAERRERGGR